MNIKRSLIAALVAALSFTSVASAQIAQDAVTGSSGGGTPGGSSGQVQFNNGGSFGGFNLNSYVSGNWYAGVDNLVASPNASGLANYIMCHYVVITQKITIDSLGAAVINAGSSNAQFAIYTHGTNGRPATLVGNTGSVANTSNNTTITAALAVNKEVGPGGADGDSQLWFCVNQNDSTGSWVSFAGNTTYPSYNTGSATASVALNSNVNSQFSGVLCNGANCQGGSSTFGTWPASLATSTWTEMSPGNTGNLHPMIIFKVN